MFGQYIIANSVYKGAQSLRSCQPIASQDAKHTQEGLLSRVFICLLPSLDATELTFQHFTEVRHEVTFGLRIALSKSLDILGAEKLVSFTRDHFLGSGVKAYA